MGQEKLFSLTNNYYKNCIAAIVVYDITDKKSFQNCKNWINKVKDKGHKNMKIILVGNKLDLDVQRKVSTDQALLFAS